jgi:hypothetical protein
MPQKAHRLAHQVGLLIDEHLAHERVGAQVLGVGSFRSAQGDEPTFGARGGRPFFSGTGGHSYTTTWGAISFHRGPRRGCTPTSWTCTVLRTRDARDQEVKMADDQRNARLFGVLFVITFLTAIPAVLLFQPVLDDPAGYIAGAGEDNQIYLGAFLELLLIAANVGTAVVLYPIARRQNEVLAIGFVGARIIESVFIAAGIIFVLGVVTLGQDSPGAADLAVSLAALKDWTFLFGPGFIVPLGNGLILGYLMYRSGLVPRRMALLGLIGGPLLLISSIGVLFDWWDAGTTIPALLVVPEFLWELSLGVYAAVWGFRRAAPILSANAR